MISALALHMSRDVIGIICAYHFTSTVRLIRPFRERHCLVCRVPHKRYRTNLCDEHADICALCLGPHKRYRASDICKPCITNRPWFTQYLTGAFIAYNPTARLYAHRDELDWDKMKQCVNVIVRERNRLSRVYFDAQMMHMDAAVKFRMIGWPYVDPRPEIVDDAYNAKERYFSHSFNLLLAMLDDKPYEVRGPASIEYVP